MARFKNHFVSMVIIILVSMVLGGQGRRRRVRRAGQPKPRREETPPLRQRLDVPPEVLLSACNRYTHEISGNSNISCGQGLLAHSGVKYLRRILPACDDAPGLAPLRVLDGYVVTSHILGGCNYTLEDDGRHFYGLDSLKLRLLAEGTLRLLGDGGPVASNKEASARWIVPPERANAVAKSKVIGDGYANLLTKAFSKRHVAFIGDSTMHPMRNQLASWMHAIQGGREAGASELRSRLQQLPGSTPVLQALGELRRGCPDMRRENANSPFHGGRCAYVGRCKQLNGCSTPSFAGGAVLSTLLFGGSGALRVDGLGSEHALTVLKKMESSARQRADVVVVNSGLHNLHLYPTRGFESNAAAQVFGAFNVTMEASLQALRRHVGETGLVVWMTTNDICDEKYSGLYAQNLAALKMAMGSR